MKQRLVILVFCAAATAWGGEFRMGRAAVKITPPVGGSSRAQGIHDDIYAKAVVLEQDGRQAAMVTCDVTGLARHVVAAGRQAVQESTGIPTEQVMISATHTHTPFAPGLERSVTPEAERYLASFIANIALAAKRAQADLNR